MGEMGVCNHCHEVRNIMPRLHRLAISLTILIWSQQHYRAQVAEARSAHLPHLPRLVGASCFKCWEDGLTEGSAMEKGAYLGT